MMIPGESPVAAGAAAVAGEFERRTPCGRARRIHPARSARPSTCQRVRAALGASLDPVRILAQDETEAAMVLRGEREAARRGQVRRFAQFGDDGRERAAFQRLFHREQRIDRARDARDQQPLGREAELVEAGAVKRAGFEAAEIGRDPERFLARAPAPARRARARSRPPRRDAPACALTSCSAAPGRPPPSAASIAGTPSASERVSSGSASLFAMARRRRDRCCSVLAGSMGVPYVHVLFLLIPRAPP